MRIMCKILFNFMVVLLACSNEAYKVLLVFPFSTKSHGILGEGYVRNLLEAGHEVTYITPFTNRTQHSKLREIDVSSNNFPDEFNLLTILNNKLDLQNLNDVFPMFNKVTELTLMNENVQNLINDLNEEFDVVVAEWLFSELYSGFAAVFDCPYIWSSSTDPHSLVLSLVDQASNPAYTPSMLSTNVPPFTFKERILELSDYVRSSLFKTFYFNDYERKQYEKWFGPAVAKRGRSLPSYLEQIYNASLVLGNCHPALGQATRLPQSYKTIGGYHVKSERDPLPEKLKRIMDNADNGVIFFSMGSTLKSIDFPEVMIKNLLKMFSQLKQEVIWKFEGDLKDLPKNVHIMNWAPQQSILFHPNCIILISHGGLLSTIEAVHFGVPFIGIPAFADQFSNVGRAVSKGYAKRVELSYNLAEDLRAAIQEVISDSRYAEKAKELSFIYHDRPIAPGKELVHWVEHVVKTRGALHLRSPALMVLLYQKLYLDLLSLGLIILMFTVFIINRLYPSLKLLKKKKID